MPVFPCQVRKRGSGEVHTRFLWKNLRERDHLENLSVDGRMIFKWIWDGGMDWIDLALDRDRWLAIVNVVMNLWEL